MITRRRAYLILVLLFTLLFMVLIATGSYLISVGQKQFGVASFLFAFASAFGQIVALALYLKEVARSRANITKQQND